MQVRIELTSVLAEHDIAGATRRLSAEEFRVPQNVSEVLRWVGNCPSA